MALDSDLDFISVHKPTGSWVCEHAGEVHAVSLAIPVEQEIGLKISDPRKAGIHYLFVLAPNDPKNWHKKANNTKFRLFDLNEIDKTKAAKKVKVVLQQTSIGPLPMPRDPFPTPAPKEAYTEDPAVKVTDTFPRMTIDVKISGKSLPQQTFAYPALFRIDAPTIGKPSLKLLWGRYDPANPAFNHVLRKNSRDDEPFSTLTEAGKRDKFAQQFNTNFKLITNSFRRSNAEKYTPRIAKDAVLFEGVIQMIDKDLYKLLASTYETTLKQTGQKVAGKDLFRKTFLHFISEQLKQTQ